MRNERYVGIDGGAGSVGSNTGGGAGLGERAVDAERVSSPSVSKGSTQHRPDDKPSPTSGPRTQPEFEFNARTQAAVKSDFKVHRLFTTRNGREMLETEGGGEAAMPLFGHIWQEGEMAVLFGERSAGKSVLAVQIADSITRGVPVEPFDHCPRKQRVLYVDLALTERQFNARYSADAEHPGAALANRYQFSTRFNRAEADPLAKMPDSFKRIEEFILLRVVQELEQTQARVLIIDNIDRLNGQVMGTRDLAFVMSRLRTMKAICGLSILILADLPRRSHRSPLSSDRLMSSRFLSTFADSVFAVGRCRRDDSYRYVKHFRSAGSEVLFDEEHVPTFRILKEGGNCLAFRFEFYKSESYHLEPACPRHDRDRLNRIKSLAASGITQRRIAKFMEMSLGAVNRAVKMWAPWNENPAKASPELLEELNQAETPDARAERSTSSTELPYCRASAKSSPTKIAQNVEHPTPANTRKRPTDNVNYPLSVTPKTYPSQSPTPSRST